MPDPIPCPACDAKIIVNGDLAATVIQTACESIERFFGAGHRFPDEPKLVEMANELENKAYKFLKEVLSQQGFQGPWPHSMKD